MKNLVYGTTLCLSAMTAQAAANQDAFHLNIPGFTKVYPMVTAPGDKNVKIAYVYDMNDQMNLLRAAADAITEQLVKSKLAHAIDAVVLPGDKANALGALVVSNLQMIKPNIELVILRSSAKGGSFKSVTYQSITSPALKDMHLREDQFQTISHKRVMVLDDVISTGATVEAAAKLAGEASAQVIAYACIATEGAEDTYAAAEHAPLLTYAKLPLIRLTHLPIVTSKS